LGHGGDYGYSADAAGGFAFEQGQKQGGFLGGELADDFAAAGDFFEVVFACGFDFYAVYILTCCLGH
jgi:hypothetical protein